MKRRGVLTDKEKKMKKMNNKIIVHLLIMILCISMTLSSCVFLQSSGRDDSKAVKSAVSDFLESIADGSYAKDDYKSSFSKDKSFSRMKFENDLGEEMMILGFKRIEFEIEESEGNQKDEEGSCEVTLKALDVKKILKDFDDGIDATAFSDAVKAKKAPMKEHEITFELEYDGDKWLITDLSELAGILGEPYSTLEFETAEVTETTTSDADDATGVVDQLLSAFRTRDFSTVETLTGGLYSEDSFLQSDWPEAADVFDCVFSKLTWNIDSVVDEEQTTVVYLSIRSADYRQAVTNIYADDSKMIALIKPVLLAYAIGGDGEAEYVKFMSNLSDMIITETLALGSISEDQDFIEVVYDETTKSWQVTYIPEILQVFVDFEYYVNPLDNYYYNEGTNRSEEIVTAAMNELLNEGAIDRETYDELMGESFTDEYTKETVLAAISSSGWIDADTGLSAESFGPDAKTIQFVVSFYYTMPDLQLVCDIYSENKTILLSSDAITLGPDDTGLTSTINLASPAKSDIFTVIWMLADGTVILEDSIEVIVS